MEWLPPHLRDRAARAAEVDFSEITHTMVTIEVGTQPDNKDFCIHKDLPCKVSPFFRNAFTKDFKEAKTGTMVLDDIEVEIFESFFTWLYSRRFTDMTGWDIEFEFSHIVDVYGLADRLDIPDLRIDVLAHLHLAMAPGRITYELPQEVFNKFSKSSPIYRYCKDVLVPREKWHSTWDEGMVELYSYDWYARAPSDGARFADTLPPDIVDSILIGHLLSRQDNISWQCEEVKTQMKKDSKAYQKTLTDGNEATLALQWEASLKQARELAKKYEQGAEGKGEILRFIHHSVE